MMMLKKMVLYWLISALILPSACNRMQIGKPTSHPNYLEQPYTDLIFSKVDPNIIVDPVIPGCRLADLRPFGWKEVDSGLVDIRTPQDYVIQIESLYQEGYLDYLQTREEYPDRYQSIPEMSYEEFFAICNVFPEVDFGRYAVLGAHATGTGCTVTFEKHVYRDEQSQKIIYPITVMEQGNCEMTFHDRNLILVRRIPLEYSVEFLIQNTAHDRKAATRPVTSYRQTQKEKNV
jgi:hypothetical protein